MRLIDADEMIKGLSKFITCKLGEIKAVDIKKFINKQPTVESNQWIPCSERLPEIEDCETCISKKVNFKDEDGKYYYGHYDFELGNWVGEEDFWVYEVVAWMPLPQAYMGKESD